MRYVSSWIKILLIIEAILFVWLIQQLTSNVFLLILLFMGLFLLMRKNKMGNSFQNKSSRVGLFFILFSLLATQAVWAMIFVAAAFLFVPLFRKDPFIFKHSTKKPPWKEKEYFSADVLERKTKTLQRKKNVWIGSDHFGRNEFEWEDLNFVKFMGETVIDLGNTILPNKENVIVIRKGFGNTKILVPPEVGVAVSYTSLIGKCTIEEEEIPVRNEQIKYVEASFDTKPRKLHIILNVLVGEIEVVPL